MGGGKRHLKGGKWQKGGKRRRNRKEKWDEIKMENPMMEKYYKGQSFLPDEEFTEFLDTLKRPLPMTFRISKYDGMYKHVRGKLEAESFFGGVDFENLEGKDDFYKKGKVVRPVPMPWYREQLGWYFIVSKKDLKKFPPLDEFRKWLVSVTEIGTVTRQEAVSMIPPLFMDIKPHHWVLDMCAAPGSKTCQLLEFLHEKGASHIPEGIVIANDADRRRAHMLTKQIKRLRSPNFLVTNHPAQFFPNLFVEEESGASSKPASSSLGRIYTNRHGEQYTQVRFDRILCDVPCTGDGTLRKNALLWKNWTVMAGYGLHYLQYRIALRGAQLLKPGGIMVYSTCSFNPVENEAVVARLLYQCAGGLVLEKAQLEGLKIDKGLETWKLMDKKGEFLTSYDTVKDEKLKEKLSPFMFPPPNAKELGLEKCMRLMPHRQDTGGFFVAVLKRTEKHIPIEETASYTEERGRKGNSATENKPAKGGGEGSSKPSNENGANAMSTETTAKIEKGGDQASSEQKDDSTTAAAAATAAQGGNSNKRRHRHGEDPFEPVDEVRVNKLIDFYGLNVAAKKTDKKEEGGEGASSSKVSSVPAFNPKCLCQRNSNSKKLSFLAPSVAMLVQNPRNDRLKVIHCGLRAFERTESFPKDTKSKDRVAQDGAMHVLPFLSKQTLKASAVQFLTFFKVTSWKFAVMDESLKEQAQKLDKGGCAIVLDDPDRKVSEEHFVVAGWVTGSSLNIMCNPMEREAMKYAILEAYPNLAQQPVMPTTTTTTTTTTTKEG